MPDNTRPTGDDVPRSAPAKPRRNHLRVCSRLATIADLIRRNGGVCPTQAELLDQLRRLGVKTSIGSIVNDLSALGLNNAPSAHVYRSPTIRAMLK